MKTRSSSRAYGARRLAGVFLLVVPLGPGMPPAAAQDPGAFLDVFVSAGSGGLDAPVDLAFGPDGRLYVSGFGNNAVPRYSGSTGAFLDAFIASGNGGLDGPAWLVFGPDGHLYVGSARTDEVLRYDGTTGASLGAFIPSGSGGLDAPFGLVFGPDGHLYVGSFNTDAVLRFDGATGASLGVFVAPGSGGLDAPRGLAFGPDGHLYVSSANTGGVLRYHGSTGAFLDEFVSRGSGGLSGPVGLVFGPDGHLYVASGGTDAVLRYGGNTGVFLDAFVAAGSGGLDNPTGLVFGPDGHLYVVSSLTHTVLRYGGAQANRLPTVISALADQRLEPGGASFTTDLAGVFEDADGDALAFSAVSSDPDRATARVSGATLTVMPQAAGQATLTVTADDGKGGQAQTAFDVVVYPSSLRYTVNRRFNDAPRQTDYRLVGLPGALDLPTAATLSGAPGDDWRVFRDTGSEGADSLAEFDGTPAFNFRPGRGFWLLSKAGWTPAATVPTVTLSADGTVSVPIHDGWNILSNPFDRDVAWAAVLAVNGLAATTALFRWNGFFEPTAVFTAATGGEAFYFFNDAGLRRVAIPYPGIATIPETPPLPAPSRVLTVSAFVDGQQASSVQLGVAAEAETGLDDYDQAAAPGYFEAASLRLLGAGGTALAAEYRPEGAADYAFEVALRAAEEGWVTVAVDGVDAFAGRAVFLVDDALARAYDVRDRAAVPLWATPKTRRYRLLIGTPAFVEAAANERVPEAIALLPNYPNPFNPHSMIAYALPPGSAGAPVRLEVYDAAGRRVRVLVAARQDAGWHQVPWDGTDEAGAPVASGVYVYRLRVGALQRARTMILLK